MRKPIDNFKNYFLSENLDRRFKNKILSSLKNTLDGYNKLPKEIKKLINFNQMPMDVYQKIVDYYEFEKTLPKNTYIKSLDLKLKLTGREFDEDFLGFIGFIELIGINKFNRYNTIKLYNAMLDEIRNLPDIKKSDDVINDYNIFRKRIKDKASPTRNLRLVIISRFLEEYRYFSKLVN